MIPPELLGPTGLLIALSIAVAALWRDHVRADQRERDDGDRAWALLEGVTPALKDLAAAQSAANRDAELGGRRRDDT